MIYLISKNNLQIGAMRYSKWFCLLIVFIFLLEACYSFKGVTIPADVNTYYVENFNLSAPNAPVEIDIQFSEALRTKVRTESRLKLTDTDPDVVFAGQITGYQITSEAPREGNTVALNKLDISVQVQFTNHKNDKESYSRSFSFFRTFPADQDLQAVQETLNRDIIKQLTEKIFNETFASW
jgi:hypothetical protein